MAYNLTAEGAETNRNVPYAYAPGFPVIAPSVVPPAGAGSAIAPRQLTWDEWARRAPTATGVAPPPTPASAGAGGFTGARWTPAPSTNFGLNMVVGGGNNPLPEIANRVEADAAQNGLTAWGYSLLRQLGRTIKPEWLKESSKEWFNKELPEPWIPPKEEFVKFVEPLAGSSTYGNSAGINQLRHKYGLEVSPKFKGHEYVLEQDPAKRAEGRTPPPVMQNGAAKSAVPEVTTGEPTRETSQAQLDVGATLGTPDQIINGMPTGGTQTFLPPYLQPGQPGQPGGLTTAVQPAAQPAPMAPVTPPGSPVTPFVPAAATGMTSGSPVQPFAPAFAQPKNQGGFAATAKLLELPFYLRGLYG